jgi:hypothetical protein
MFEIALPLVLSCSQANILMIRIYGKDYPPKIERELFREIKDLSPKWCEWRLWNNA